MKQHELLRRLSEAGSPKSENLSPSPRKYRRLRRWQERVRNQLAAAGVAGR